MKSITYEIFDQLDHLVWDWNGTLFDDTDLCIDVMNGLLAEHALPQLTRARYHAIFDFPVRGYYEQLGFDFSRNPFEIVGAEFIRRYELRRGEAHLQPCAREALATVEQRGYTQSLLSAYRHDTLESLLNETELRPFFSGILGSDNVYAEGKIEQGRRWMRELGLNPDRVMLVGDTVHDADVASAMGCRCCLIAHGYHTRDKLTPLGVPVLDDLQAFLETLPPHAP